MNRIVSYAKEYSITGILSRVLLKKLTSSLSQGKNQKGGDAIRKRRSIIVKDDGKKIKGEILEGMSSDGVWLAIP